MSTTMSKAQEVLQKAQQNSAAKLSHQVTDASVHNTQMEANVPATKEKEYQVYHSARQSMQLITYKGNPVRFLNGILYTDSIDVIEYLDNEIYLGALPGITKGEKIVQSDMDPIAALRKKIYAEILAEQEAAKLNNKNLADMGSNRS